MCGIVYAHNFNGEPVNNDVLQQFDMQRSRGTQGFGLFDGQEKHMVHSANEDKILNWLVKYDSNLILFHHRMPTSTVNVKRAAHPFSTKDYFGDTQYILVHNGHISNSKEVREAHEKQGIVYHSKLTDKTFNDSEALCWDLALTLEGKQSALEAHGGIAFVCLKLVKGELDKMYFGRNGNPLKLFRDEHGIALSSEGKGEMIELHTLYTYNYKLNRLTNRQFHISHYNTSSYSGSRPWGSSDEINEGGRDWRGDDFYRAPSGGLSGDWLPNHLKSKFGRWLKPKTVLDYDSQGDPIFAKETQYNSYDDYMRSKNGLLLPANTVMLDQQDGEWINEDDIETSSMSDDELSEYLETYEPSQGEIESNMLQYLISAEGHFETAYWSLEGDYEMLESIMDQGQAVLKDFKDARLTERTLSLLMDDPEYLDETSVSSKWEAICNQANLLDKTLPLPV